MAADLVTASTPVEERLLGELDCCGLKVGKNRGSAATHRCLHSLELKLEAPPGFEPGMEVLQTSALPLGDGAD